MSEPKVVDGNGFDLCDVRVVHLDRVVVAKERAVARGLVGELSALFKVLGDATRLRLVLALRDQEMCVCDLAAVLGMTESAVSHQLRRLRDQALVAVRRDGQVVYYSLDDDHVAALLEVALLHAGEVSR